MPAPRHLQLLADRVGEARDLAQAVGHRHHPVGIEREAVQKRRAEPRRPTRLEIAGVGGLDVLATGNDPLRHCIEHAVLRRSVQASQRPRRRRGTPADFQDLLLNAYGSDPTAILGAAARGGNTA